MFKHKQFIFYLFIISYLAIGSQLNLYASETSVSEDARVVKDEPNSNYGKSAYLQVDSVEQERESYIKINKTHSSEKTYLSFYVLNETNGNVNLYLTNNNWSENSITWKNKPTKTRLITSLSKMEKGKYKTFDISNEARQAGTYSFVISNTSRDGVSFYSQTGKYPPKLEYAQTNNTPTSTSPNNTTPPNTTPCNQNNLITGICENQTVSGNIYVTYNSKSPDIKKVEFNLTGPSLNIKRTEYYFPYALAGNLEDKNQTILPLDTTKFKDGRYQLNVAIYTNTQSSQTSLSFTVNNLKPSNTNTPNPTPIACTIRPECNITNLFCLLVSEPINGWCPEPIPTNNPTSAPNCPTGFDCQNDQPLPTNSSSISPNPTVIPTPTKIPNTTALPTPTKTTNPTGLPTPTKTPNPTIQPTTNPTNPPNTNSGGVKIAFFGDSGASNGFQAVLDLVKSEKAEAVVESGDLAYSSSNSTFESKINSTLGSNYPYFYAKGNHDTAWSSSGNYAQKLSERLARIGITPSGSVASTNYSVVYKNIKLVVTDAKNSGFAQQELQNDNHTWKICSQHFVQRSLHTGPKGDESNYSMYEACRKAGALIATAHSHTYSRSKTLSNISSASSISTTSNSQSDIRMSKLNGTTFTFTNGMGGNGFYHQGRCYTLSSEASCGIWATNNSGIPISLPDSDKSNYGVLFITFGSNNKGSAYFKDINGTTLDTFNITAD